MAGRANRIKKKWAGVAVALSLVLLLRISSREEQEVVVACRKDQLEKNTSVQSKECSPDNLSEHEEQMRVALTFDDGPHPVYTPRLLDGLKARGVHASFFMVGENAAANP